MRAWPGGERSPSPEFVDRLARRLVLVISPHLDDAPLSCGGTLAELAHRQAEALLVTVFTADPPPENSWSPLARALADMWQAGDQPMETRRLEDAAVACYLGFDYRWLGFTDVLYRELNLNHREELRAADYDATKDQSFDGIVEALAALMRNAPGATVLAPLAVGNHRDHLLVHEAVRRAARRTQDWAMGVFFYEDFPYALDEDPATKASHLPEPCRAVTVDISTTLSDRIHLIAMYRSQLPVLFGGPDGMAAVVTAYAERAGEGRPQERFWYPPSLNGREDPARFSSPR